MVDSVSKLKGNFIIIVLSVILVSCGENKATDNIPSFQRKLKLEHESINVKGLNLSSLNQMVHIDSFLIITDAKANEFMIFILDIHNNFLYRRGRKGRGPGELGIPFRLNKSKSSRHFEIYDFIQKKAFIFNVDSCITNNHYIPISRNVPKDFFDVIFVNDSILIGSGVLEKGRLALKSQDTVKYFLPYPADGSNVQDRFKAMAYQGIVKINHDKNILILSCFHAGLVDYIKVQKDLLIPFKNFKFHYASYVENQQGNGYGVMFKRENMDGFKDITLNKRFVYFLYSGRDPESYKQMYAYSNTIWKADWEGNFLEEYNLDVDVSCISIDEENKTMFAVQVEPEVNLVKFDLE